MAPNKICLSRLFTPGKDDGGMSHYWRTLHKGYEKCDLVIFDGPVPNKESYWFLFAKMILFPNSNSYTKTFVKYLEEKDINIFHITDFTVFTYFIIKKCSVIVDKIILTLHDPIPHQEKKIIKKISRIIVIHYINKVLALSKSRSNIYIHVHSLKLVSKKLDAANFIVQPHPNSFVNSEVNRLFKFQNSIYFSFVGRLEYYKGLDILIESLKILDQILLENELLTLVIAGKGNAEFPDYKFKYINLIFINKYLDDNEFDSIIKFSTCLVLPYRGATQSGVISRAIPLRTPVICTNTGVLSEYIIHNVTGFILEPDPKAIANILIKVMRQPSLLSNCRSNLDLHMLKYDSRSICQTILSKVN